VDQKYLERFEMWCWRRTEFSWTDRVRNEEVLLREKEEMNFVRTVKRGKVKWVGHILCWNFLFKHVTEEKVEGNDKSDGKMTKKMEAAINDLQEKSGSWKLNDGLDRTL